MENLNNEDEREVRYLPVLYTVPRWKMYRTYGKKGLEYYVPQIDEYVSKLRFEKVLKSLGMTPKQWYDRWIMNSSVELNLKCEYPECNENATFLGASPSRGYRMSCSCKEHILYVQRLKMSNSHHIKFISDPEFYKKRGETLSDRYKSDPILSEAARERGKRRYEDPKERERTSILTKSALNLPGMHEKLSKSQKDSYNSDKGVERRNKLSISGKKRYEDPRERERQSEIAKEIASRPGVTEKRVASWKETAEKMDTINKISRNSLIMWNNPSELRLSAKGGFGIQTYINSIWGDNFWTDSSYETLFVYYLEIAFGSLVELHRELVISQYQCLDKGIIKYKNYIIDFYVKILDKEYLVEVKPNYLLDDNESKFVSADDLCYLLGLEYVVITEDFLFNGKSPFYGDLGFLINQNIMSLARKKMKSDQETPGKVKSRWSTR